MPPNTFHCHGANTNTHQAVGCARFAIKCGWPSILVGLATTARVIGDHEQGAGQYPRHDSPKGTHNTPTGMLRVHPPTHGVIPAHEHSRLRRLSVRLQGSRARIKSKHKYLHPPFPVQAGHMSSGCQSKSLFQVSATSPPSPPRPRGNPKTQNQIPERCICHTHKIFPRPIDRGGGLLKPTKKQAKTMFNKTNRTENTTPPAFFSFGHIRGVWFGCP